MCLLLCFLIGDDGGGGGGGGGVVVHSMCVQTLHKCYIWLQCEAMAFNVCIIEKLNVLS